MSPEQCKGLSLDGRSDIYSLGCLMYQSISGALPFLGENALQTLNKHIRDPPPPFDEVVPALAIPKALQDIIFKALEKELRIATVPWVNYALILMLLIRRVSRLA